MKKVTLTVLFIISMAFFTGHRVDASNSNSTDNSPTLTFSDADNSAETFSSVDVLDGYIKMSPASVQVFYYTRKYCQLYDISETLAFRVARLETTYRGPDVKDYNPVQISSGNALGPYQLLLSTARDMYVLLGLGERHELTRQMLLDDVELNVMLGIRYLRWLHDNISKDWKIVAGFYNTGYKMVNDYALYAAKYM